MITKLLAKEITRKEASFQLNISIRQVDRLTNKLKECGKDSFLHKNRGKESKKKIDQSLKQEIINLYLKEYSDYNFQHFYEETSSTLNTSYSTVFRVLTEEEILSPEAQGKTVREYHRFMKQARKDGRATKEQDMLYEQRREEEKQKHFRKSTFLYRFGQEVQMDAAFGIWFGEIPTALHLAVDRATKTVLAGCFDSQEFTRTYFVLLMKIMTQFGIPQKIRTDKRGSFSINSSRHHSSKLDVTQFGRVCRDLEIHLETNSNPLFKPNVERENKTFKGRLMAELRHENIKKMEEANKYLNEVFIPKINARFAYEIDKEHSVIRTCEYTSSELNLMISEQYTRKIDHASSFKYHGKYYMPVRVKTGEVISYPKDTECTILIAYDKTYWCSIQDILYDTVEVKTRQPIGYQKTTKSIEEINKSKAHKPSANHPWKTYSKTSLK